MHMQLTVTINDQLTVTIDDQLTVTIDDQLTVTIDVSRQLSAICQLHLQHDSHRDILLLSRFFVFW
jgi:antitoxin component of MazEF toxin-antitoxin module